MPTLAEPVTGIELTVLESLEFDPPCDFNILPGRGECADPAEWILIYNCGHERQFCTKHKEAILDYITGSGFYCAQCYPNGGNGKHTCASVIRCEPIRGY